MAEGEGLSISPSSKRTTSTSIRIHHHDGPRKGFGEFLPSKSTCLMMFLCFYGTIKEIKVGEPFMFKYQTEYLNFTSQQLTSEIYPFYTYAYLLALVPILLFADIFLYKPIMFIEVMGQIGYRSSLVFTKDVFSQQAGQMAYGVASASELAFFSYVYGIVEKDKYKTLTTWTRAGTMGGRTFGYTISQIIILYGLGTYRTINEIAFVIPCIVLACCLCLPRVHWKTIVERILQSRKTDKTPVDPESLNSRPPPGTYCEYIAFRARKLRSEFMRIYSVGYVRKWSFWWAMTTCMSLQVVQFAQALWGEVQTDTNNPLNGFAEAGYTLTAALAIVAVNLLPFDWDRWGETSLVVISTIDAVLLFLYSQTQSIYVMYGCYIGYRSLYQVMITIAQWNIAKKMICESYALAFGVNSFIALVMQSLLMIVIADKRGLALDVRTQFAIYAACHLLIAVVFLASIILSSVDGRHDKTAPYVSESALLPVQMDAHNELVDDYGDDDDIKNIEDY